MINMGETEVAKLQRAQNRAIRTILVNKLTDIRAYEKC